VASDAHVHPCDLLECDSDAEETRRRLGIAAAASAWNRAEFGVHRKLAAAARADGGPPLFLCFAVHPQAWNRAGDSLAALEEYAAAGLLAAIGETGLDLYGEYRAGEEEQKRLFAVHLETALRFGLPLVLHARRAMPFVFSQTGALKKLPAVMFHSWPGSPEEGFSLLRRGVNAFFSFGTAIMLNHKNAIRSCAAFPAGRILFETDAPWQPPAGKAFSSWKDLSAIVETAAGLRNVDTEELERAGDENFFSVFCPGAGSFL
jgi:TatD DNase family protein